MSAEQFKVMLERCDGPADALRRCYEAMGDSALAEEACDKRCGAHMVALDHCAALSFRQQTRDEDCARMIGRRPCAMDCQVELCKYISCASTAAGDDDCQMLLTQLLRCGLQRNFVLTLN